MRSSIIILVFFIQIVSAQLHPMQWEHQKPISNHIQLDYLPNWILITDKDKTDIGLPFVFENTDTLYLANTFTIDMVDSSADWMFVTHGFFGKAVVQINGTIIASLPETLTRSVRYLPSGVLRPGRNNISITLSKPRTFKSGFLRFAHLFTEPLVLGISRPFYLEKQTVNPIQDFSYKISFIKGANILNYSYKLNPDIRRRMSGKNGLTSQDFIGDKQIKHSLTTENKLIHGEIILSAKQLWSVENPVLIPVKIRVKRFERTLGQFSFMAGFKDVHMEDQQMFFNGLPVQIRGVVYHQNILSLSNQPILHQYRMDMIRIKKMGFNAVRFADHIPDQRMLSLCDSLGLMTFVEFPVVNYPGKMFKRDDLLELLSGASANFFASLLKHPSLTAIGLGNGTLEDLPAVQKFYYILKINMHKPAPVLTYLSPTQKSVVASSAQLSDFYAISIRDDIHSYLPALSGTNHVFSIFSSLGTPDGFYREKNKDVSARVSYLRNDLSLLQTKAQIGGGFIDAYADWFCSGPQQGVEKSGAHYLIANGFVTLQHQLKSEYSDGKNNPWENKLSVDTAMSPKHRTNVFSLIMFFGMIFFFLFYHRYPRFKENFKRALQHPYGFFVDMRERRIIPVFNTLITGASSALILATFCASFIYYFNGSYRFQEIIATLSANPTIHASILAYSRSSLSLVLSLFIVLYLHPLIIGVILKLLSTFTNVRLRLRQAIGAGMWAGLPWIFLFPVVLAGYQILSAGGFFRCLAILFVLFNFWAFYRLVNGIRILTLTRFRTVFILLLLSYVVPVIMFLLLVRPHLNWLVYINYLIQSAPLFNG